MPLIREWFGRDIKDTSQQAEEFRRGEFCPFIGLPCTKRQRGLAFGTCSIETRGEGVVPICPKRLYAENHRMLRDVARIAFGEDANVVHPTHLKDQLPASPVVALGEGYGGEIKIPSPTGSGASKRFSVDWILARIGTAGEIAEFVAVEVQSIDTTGSARPSIEKMREGARGEVSTNSAPNWENVNKRILPQLIYKGHVLRQEAKCAKGLFFVCPSAVYRHIRRRLAEDMVSYPLQPGAITFVWYEAGDASNPHKSLSIAGSMTTTGEQLVLAFSGARNLPPKGAYLAAIERALDKAKRGLLASPMDQIKPVNPVGLEY